MQIVLTYYDKRKSALTIDRRDALKQLIKDVQSGARNFRRRVLGLPAAALDDGPKFRAIGIGDLIISAAGGGKIE